jgi:hypothetical protein
MKGTGSSVFNVIKALMGDKLPEQMRDSLSVLLEGDGNLSRIIGHMNYNCEFELVAEIAYMVYLMDPHAAGGWLDLLVNDFNLDNKSDYKIKQRPGDYRIVFGTILAIFKIANELTLCYSKLEEAKEILPKLPDLIYKLMINEGPMHIVVNSFLFGMSSENLKTLNKFKSALATEITAYVRGGALKNLDLRDQRLREIRSIFKKVMSSNKVWDKNSIGGLILEQICYAKFGELGINSHVEALERFLSETLD